VSRDRDPAGRPRNARPRDSLGRPLPRNVPPEADQLLIPENLDPDDGVRLADELLRTGRPFHAHEVLEDLWKSGPEAERDLWQGLAQIAVGLTHAHRGNARGAITLLNRGARRVRSYRGDTHHIDVAAILDATDALADRIEHRGLDDVPPADLCPGLTSGSLSELGEMERLAAGRQAAPGHQPTCGSWPVAGGDPVLLLSLRVCYTPGLLPRAERGSVGQTGPVWFAEGQGPVPVQLG
jgi:uncharacterized protein